MQGQHPNFNPPQFNPPTMQNMAHAVITRDAMVTKTPQTQMQMERANLIPNQLQRKKLPTKQADPNSQLSAFFSEINQLDS